MKTFKSLAFAAVATGALALFGCNDRREPRIEEDTREAAQETREDTREAMDEVRDDVDDGIGGAGTEGEIGDGKIGEQEGVINDGEGPFEEGQRPLDGNGVLEGGDGVNNGK